MAVVDEFRRGATRVTDSMRFLLACAITVSCGRVVPGGTVAVVPSPDGNIEAIVTESGAGATTSFTYSVYLTLPGIDRSQWDAPAVSLYGAIRNEHAYGVNVKWLGQNALHVECLRASGIKVRRPVSKVNGTRIVTSVVTGVVDPTAPPGSMASNALSEVRGR